MAQTSAIEWTEATWNPVTGCDQVSPGCAHCYAKIFAERWRGIPGHPYEQGFDLRLWPQRLEVPLRWRKPKTIFVNSMSDLFHEDIPLEFVEEVFATMRAAHWHTFQILTKRHERLAELADYFDWPPNVWMGVTIENRRFIGRAEALRTVPAAVRFISAEPLLGPLDDLTSRVSTGSLPVASPAPAIGESMSTGCAHCATPANGRMSPSSSSNGADTVQNPTAVNSTVVAGTTTHLPCSGAV